MKTAINFLTACVALLLCMFAKAQTNYSVSVPAGQQVRNMYGNICCLYKINVETDEAGNAYVLSENETDSSMWVTKYDYNGNLIYNTHVESAFTSSNKYLGKKIRVYDRVYVLCKMIDPTYGPSENVFTLDKNTGVVDLTYTSFVPAFGYTGSELIDLYATGNTVWQIGQVYNNGGPGSNRMQVTRTDLTWTGNIYVLGNDGGTDYLLNTESTCFDQLNGALYMTGQTSSGSGNNIFISKLDVWGFYSEYIYQNSSYTAGGKGLRIAAEGNSVYVAGAVKQTNRPFKTAVIKMDSMLTAPVWVNINRNSVWPLGLELSSTDIIYTVDFTLKVVGFSKATGSQLFAKNDFRNNAQVYNQPITTAILNNNQLAIQASIGVRIGNGNNAVNTVNKVLAKYSTSGTKVFQQTETLALISPGNAESAEALGMAYSSATDYLTEVYRKNTGSGELLTVQGRTSPTALRPMAEQDETASQFSIYPNPSSDVVNITSPTTIDEITVTNATGQLVLLEKNIGTQYSLNLNLPGIYFVKLISGNKVEMQRIVITQ
jgi:hypothetical protein